MKHKKKKKLIAFTYGEFNMMIIYLFTFDFGCSFFSSIKLSFPLNQT